jgi:hypothetical protein
MFGNANTANLSTDKGFSGVTPAFVAVCGANAAGRGPTNAISRHQFGSAFIAKAPSDLPQSRFAAISARRRSVDNIDIMVRPNGRISTKSA